MNKFVKVINGTTSSANPSIHYKINEVNCSNEWNPNALKGKDYGGFSYTTEESIIRWLHRGDTIYDVEVPSDADNRRVEGETIIYRTNKIILRNPKKVTDDLVLYYYNISSIPEETYYITLPVLAIMNYRKTAYQLLKDKENKKNIEEVISKWNYFIYHGGEYNKDKYYPLVEEIEKELYKIKNK